MSRITTHVLDTALGRPAAGVHVVLERASDDGGWALLARGETDADGRVADLGPDEVDDGTYRIRFDTREYFERGRQAVFFPEVIIPFQVADARHHHVPLLLSPFGYSTYRGS
jgi:5-hydroxyisourate hydrolase